MALILNPTRLVNGCHLYTNISQKAHKTSFMILSYVKKGYKLYCIKLPINSSLVKREKQLICVYYITLYSIMTQT